MTTNSFLDPSTTSMLSSWFNLVYLIWYYYLSVKFAMWIMKQKTENEQKKFKMTTYLKDSLNSNHARLGTIGVGVFRRRRSVVKPWSSLPRSVTSSPFNFRFNKKLGHFTKLTLQQSDCLYLPPSSKVLDGKSFPQRWNILDAPVHTY